LVSSGIITESVSSGGISTTGSLITSGAGGTTLGGANSVSVFSASDSGAISLNNTAATLNLGAINSGALNITENGSIGINDTQVISSGNMTMNVGGNLSVTANAIYTLLQAGGSQTINFTGSGIFHLMTTQGGNNSAFSGAFSSIESTGLQTIGYDSTGGSTLDILVAGGSANNNINTAYQYVNNVSTGNVVCTSCATYNWANVQSAGGQTIAASTITVNGGSGISNAVAGSGNLANIQNTSSTIAQNITTTGAISLTGGTAPGFFNASYPNDSVTSEANIHSDGTQIVHAASISLSGGGDASTLGGAFLTGKLGQTIATTGNLTLTGGASNTAGQYGIGAPAVIGEQNGTAIDLIVGGALSMTGGAGLTSPALIGAAQGAPGISITAANFSMSTGTGASSQIGVLTGGAAGTLSVTSTAGNISEDTTSKINTASLSTISTGGTTLSGANFVVSLNATDTGGVSINNTAATLTLGTINSVGLTVNNTGAIALGGAITEGTGNIGLTASSAISEAGSLATTGTLTTTAATGTTLNGSNAIGVFHANNTTSGNVELTNTIPLTVTGINNTGGNVTLNNTGTVNIAGMLAAGSVSINSGSGSIDSAMLTGNDISAGTVNMTASTGIGGSLISGIGVPIKIDTFNLNSAITASGGVEITNTPTPVTPIGTVTLGNLSTGDNSSIIYTQNGHNLNVTGTVSSKGGAITIDPVMFTMGTSAQVSSTVSSQLNASGGPIQITASGAMQLATINAGSGLIALNAGGSISSVSGVSPNLIGGSATIAAIGGANFSTTISAANLDTTSVVGGVSVSYVSLTPTTQIAQIVSTVTGTTSSSNSSGNSSGNLDSTFIIPSYVTGGAITNPLGGTVSGTIGGTAGTFGDSEISAIPATGSSTDLNKDKGGTTLNSDSSNNSDSNNKNGNGASDQNNSNGKPNAKPNKC